MEELLCYFKQLQVSSHDDKHSAFVRDMPGSCGITQEETTIIVR
jgi:hypothetical protein